MDSKKTRLFLVVAISILLLVGSYGSRKEEETNAPPVVAPLVQLIQPAFADQYANKVVQFDARYMSTMPMVMDLPSKYRSDYVRIMVSDVNNPAAFCNNLVIPKADSNVVFTLQPQALITVVAKAIPVKTTAAMTGSSQSNLLFEVQSITPK